MKIKVCGMKEPKNISNLSLLPINYMGLIFYSKSPRYVDDLDPQFLNCLPENIKKVGVFVNESIEFVLHKIKEYKLQLIQLHGSESPNYCLQIKKLSDVEIIKAFNVSENSDFQGTELYEDVCNYFLFDTKTSQYGGSGERFNWQILNFYQGKLSFFLSGGISIENIEDLKKINHPKLLGIDLNSRFEISPGLKNMILLNDFAKKIKN